MFRRKSTRFIALLLAMVMIFGMVPATDVFAETVDTTNYVAFMDQVKQLEVYAQQFVKENEALCKQKKWDVTTLTLNYLRSRVDRYNDGNWITLAKENIVEFAEFVGKQDAANGTHVGDLEWMVETSKYTITIPNGDQVDFGHMFGCMNISYVNVGSSDLSGWAGDLCDLVFYCLKRAEVKGETVDEMADFIRENLIGVDAPNAFGWDDLYGDLDAFYLISKLRAGKGMLSELMEEYFTADLTMEQRTEYFLKTRFDGLLSPQSVRDAIYGVYANDVGVDILASKRLNEEPVFDLKVPGNEKRYQDLRKACCYALADYFYMQAGHLLDGSTSGGDGETFDNPYYSVFSSTHSTLAPGITQTISYATTVDGKQIVYYVATVDVNRDDVTIMANYKDNDPSLGWGMQRVEDQANALLKNNRVEGTDFSVIVATNADGYNMTTGEPGGLLVMGGVEWHPVDGDGFFAILKDGTAMIGTKADYAIYKDQIQEAVGGFGAILVKDGELATTNNSGRASRTAIGITADGKVVMMVMDGRQEPFSAGGSMAEIAQVMLDAGCVHAINLDGGGSTTYLSKPEGSDDLTLVNRPSDGYARSVSTSLVAVSTAKSSKEFDHANITSTYDYVTTGTAISMYATGVSNTGYAAKIPEGAIWQVSNENIAEIDDDGNFIAYENGDVDVELVIDGVVVGSKTIHVVIPDKLLFAAARIVAIYDMETELELELTYKGNPVAFNEADIILRLENERAGDIYGMKLIGNEKSGIRNVKIQAKLASDESLEATANIAFYKKDEAYFDFDNATAGNRTLAWLREVANSTTKDQQLYQLVTPGEDMSLDYTFALDMTTIAIPDQLADLTYMLPGADAGATAWEFLLQLAERISVLTEVRITLEMDEDLDVDISELRVSNDYFLLHSAEIVPGTNTVVVVCKWIDQTAAIDPATANPLCILSGIKATPKAGAEWDSQDRLVINNMGYVGYKAFMRASSLYSFAQSPSNQAKYGLTPYSGGDEQYYVNGEPLYHENGFENGAWFGSTYAELQDYFILDSTVRQGWELDDKLMYYYKDNVSVTGVQYLPSYEDPSTKLYYRFDENGLCQGVITGLIDFEDGKLMYAVQGVLQARWQSILDENGESYHYYFDPKTYEAVGGEANWYTVENYQYYFENFRLVKGSLVLTSKGYQYRYAGAWQRNQWINWEGNWYYLERDYVALSDGFYWIRNLAGDVGNYCHYFDENSVWQCDYTGLYHVDDNPLGDTYYIEKGIRVQEAGVVYVDGYYYYFAANAKAVKNRTYWPSKTNGLLPGSRSYDFDEYGRITNPPSDVPPVVEPEEPEIPDEPDEPEVPDIPEIPDDGEKDGIVHIDGAYYYYVDGELQKGAGLVYEGGYYYYILTSGRAAVGYYFVSKANDLLEPGLYQFDKYGRMIIETEEEPEEPEQPDVPDGIVEEDGKLYYYIDGEKQFGNGIVKLELEDGRVGFIYVRSTNGQVVTGIYWPTYTNDLLPYGAYDFGTDGIYIPAYWEEPTPEVKNGIYEEGGSYYYYVDGVRQVDKGVIQLVDDQGRTFYIYVRSTGQLATGKYWPTKTNGYPLQSNRSYDWGTDGRLYL